MIIVLIYILVILLFAFFKKIDAFSSFFDGAKNTYQTLSNLFINIFMIIFSINVFIKSGIVDFILNILNINNDYKLLFMQIIFKPISWSSSLLIMDEIFNEFGVDSKMGILSSLIQASCDTCFYVTLLYLSHVKISKNSHIVLTSILSIFLTFLFCVLLTNFFVKV